MTLLHAHQRHLGDKPAQATLTLPFDKRQKSRLRARLDDGREVSVVLERGRSLQAGDKLETTQGEVIVVQAEPELVSVVRCSDALLLSRAAYHLGNRHMPLQIQRGELRYSHDHVLDDMLQQLGLQPTSARLPFEPESGAYGHGHQFATHHHHGSAHAHPPDGEHGTPHTAHDTAAPASAQKDSGPL